MKSKPASYIGLLNWIFNSETWTFTSRSIYIVVGHYTSYTWLTILLYCTHFCYKYLRLIQALATDVKVRQEFLWPVPRNWTLAEAATVPVAYTTAYYALVVRGRIYRGERVLIHSGSGAVGQAAIRIALSYGCDVFTTVGTEEKRQHLLTMFPELKHEHIFKSRDTSFEKGVMRATAGQGRHI